MRRLPIVLTLFALSLAAFARDQGIELVVPRGRPAVMPRRAASVLPWLVPLLISLGLVTYLPSISLWLPRQFQ